MPNDPSFRSPLDDDRGVWGGMRETEDLGIESEFGFEGAADVGGLAEAVTLAFERDIGDRETLGLEGGNHGFGLVWRDDLVLETLEENDRGGQAVGEVDRGAGDIGFLAVGIGGDEAI